MSGVDAIEMTLKVSVHTTVTYQAFNLLEHGMVGACFFLSAYPREGGAHCARD